MAEAIKTFKSSNNQTGQIKDICTPVQDQWQKNLKISQEKKDYLQKRNKLTRDILIPLGGGVNILK